MRKTIDVPAAVLSPTIPVCGRCCDVLAADGKEVTRRDQAQIGIACNLASPVARALGKLAFGESCSRQAIRRKRCSRCPGSCLFLKHLPILPAPAGVGQTRT